jgi:transcriptional regulator with XRE-family HTH domain
VKNPEAAFHYIVSLAIERRVTKAKLVTIAQIRQERGLSQEAVSARLDITQATYSKMERREELLVSSVVKIIRAFGGVTRIRFFFNDTHDARDLVLR